MTRTKGVRLLQRLDEPTRALLAEIGRLGERLATPAYLVGGPVRDLMLGRDALDVDVVVEGDGIVLAQELCRARGGSLTRYRLFGTARVDLPDGRRVDVATARSEEYPRPGQLPRVRSGTLQEDLARRDFSINAMALALAPSCWGALEDPFAGEADLQAGTVRILHERSFVDDPTRMLRALRFCLRFGFALAPGTARALAAGVRGGYLEWLTGDRLRRELAKLLQEAPVAAPRELERHGLLAAIHPALVAEARLLHSLAGWLEAFAVGGGGAAEPAAAAPTPGARREADEAASEETPWRAEASATAPWAAVLAATARPLLPQERWALARRLRLGRAERQVLLDAGAPWQRALLRLTAEARRTEGPPRPSLVAAALDGLCFGAILVGLAGLEGPLAEAVEDYLRRGRWLLPAVDGQELVEMGMAPGPAMGEALARLRAARLDGEVRDASQERRLARLLVARQAGNEAN